MFNWECFKIINTSLNPESSGFDSPALVLQSKSHLGGDGLALLVEHGGIGRMRCAHPQVAAYLMHANIKQDALFGELFQEAIAYGVKTSMPSAFAK